MSVERREEVKTFRLRLFCDCGEEMKYVGSAANGMSPARNVHVCQRCNRTEDRDRVYPSTEFVPA